MDTYTQSPAPNFSAVEPPHREHDQQTQFESVRQYLGLMGRPAQKQVIYTTLPACNSDI